MKNKGGRPPFVPTDEQRRTVKAMAGYGITQADIGLVVLKPDGSPLGHITLCKYFREELDTGGVVANAKVAESLFKMATHPDAPVVAAAIFWCKTRMGWRETNTLNLNLNQDAHELTDAELGKIARHALDGGAGTPSKANGAEKSDRLH